MTLIIEDNWSSLGKSSPWNTITVRVEGRITQVVFMGKFNVNFHKVSDPALLGNIKRGHDGFGSTGVEVIKKIKERESEIEVINSEGKHVTVNEEDNLQIITEKNRRRFANYFWKSS